MYMTIYGRLLNRSTNSNETEGTLLNCKYGPNLHKLCSIS